MLHSTIIIITKKLVSPHVSELSKKKIRANRTLIVSPKFMAIINDQTQKENLSRIIDTHAVRIIICRFCFVQNEKGSVAVDKVRVWQDKRTQRDKGSLRKIQQIYFPLYDKSFKKFYASVQRTTWNMYFYLFFFRDIEKGYISGVN